MTLFAEATIRQLETLPMGAVLLLHLEACRRCGQDLCELDPAEAINCPPYHDQIQHLLTHPTSIRRRFRQRAA